MLKEMSQAYMQILNDSTPCETSGKSRDSDCGMDISVGMNISKAPGWGSGDRLVKRHYISGR